MEISDRAGAFMESNILTNLSRALPNKRCIVDKTRQNNFPLVERQCIARYLLGARQ